MNCPQTTNEKLSLILDDLEEWKDDIYCQPTDSDLCTLEEEEERFSSWCYADEHLEAEEAWKSTFNK